MIDENRTLAEYGYVSDGLSPKSHKMVVAICDGCGKERAIPKSQYRALCKKCSKERQFRTPEMRKKLSDAAKKRYADDPLLKDRQAIVMKKNYEDTAARKKTSDAVRKHHKEHPSTREKMSASGIRRYERFENPGDEIVKHHYIYDYNNLENHTVEITRAEHCSIHHWMRRAGIKIPELNKKEVLQ